MEEVTRLFHSLLSTGKMGMNHSDFLNRTAVLIMITRLAMNRIRAVSYTHLRAHENLQEIS